MTLIFHLIPHTHWDREWYLPAAAFQARLVPVLDDVLDRLTEDPALRSVLLDGQTVLIEDYLRARSDREGDVRSLVRSGRLQVGPWYVLADEQIPSGEALIRNLIEGGADAERLGGRCEVLYSPDAFGHPAALPTLAREFGIKFGVAWRGVGGERGQERDLYRWAGPDGKDILLWHLPPQGYEIGAALPANRALLPAAWAAVRGALAPRAAGRHVPVFVGADHHRIHPQVGKLRDLLAELEPGSAFRVSRLDEFFQAVAENAKPAPLTGELRWSYRYTWTLQGTHGTRLPLKRENSQLELWLERMAEPLAALARRAGGRDRRPLLTHAWRTLLRCQFHDTLCGTTGDAVARRVATRFESVAALAREVTRGAVHELAGYDPDETRNRDSDQGKGVLVLWNPAARPRGGVVIADLTMFRSDVPVGPPAPGRPEPRAGPGFRPFALAAGGRSLGVQVLDQQAGRERVEAAGHYPDQDEVDVVRVAVRVPTLPGMGSGAMTVAAPARPPADGGTTVRARTLLNRDCEVTLEATGALALLDRKRGEWFFDLLRLEDAGDAGDAYTFCSTSPDHFVRAAGPIRVRRLAAGPLVAALEARFDLRCWRGTVGARLRVALHADSPIVRCILDLDNQARDHRLRARFPLELGGSRVVAGTAFGTVARAPVVVDPAQYPLETPARTAPAHRFLAAADQTRGLAILVPGFCEYEWTPQGDCLVTLLRSIGQLSRADLPSRPGHAAWLTDIPLAQCPGPTRVEFGLACVTAADVERGDVIPALWEDAFLPVRGFWLRDAESPAAGLGRWGIALEGPGLVLSALKPAHGGNAMVLRCYNATDRPAPGAWRFAEPVRSAHRVRADERESVALVLEERGRLARFTAGPREIVTVLIT